jgi:tetratricopeptide (TPR) repeat protein
MRKITNDDLISQIHLLKTDPAGYLALCNEFIEQSPSDPGAYFSRHQAWCRLDRGELALRDLDTSLALRERPGPRLARARLLARLGRHHDAMDEFNLVEALYKEDFIDHRAAQIRAYCHAQLGDEKAAIADCASLPDDFWRPDTRGIPGGTKEELAAKLREIAAEVRRGGDQSVSSP